MMNIVGRIITNQEKGKEDDEVYFYNQDESSSVAISHEAQETGLPLAGWNLRWWDGVSNTPTLRLAVV